MLLLDLSVVGLPCVSLGFGNGLVCAVHVFYMNITAGILLYSAERLQSANYMEIRLWNGSMYFQCKLWILEKENIDNETENERINELMEENGCVEYRW